jgi:transcription factor TFIIIB component B''
MIGEEVDEENMQMADIATRRSGEGKVSARAKELNVYLRDFSRRNKDRLYEENLERYERRQVLRRQIRALRNAKREERRAEVREQGGDPEDEVSEDEPNSETEFEVRPERLTPPSSPEPGGAGAERPQREDGDEEEIEEQEYVEPPEGAALGLGLDDDEDEEAAPEEPEEEIFDPNTHMPADTHERHEDEEFDPELAALGFTSGPSRYNEDDEEVDPDAGASLEQLYEELNDTRRTALQRNMEREVIEEEQTGKMPNSRSYAKKVNNERWSAEETEFFYQVSLVVCCLATTKLTLQVLGETGENYTMMSFYFPGRTQRQLKNKGRKENAAHPDRVNEAIRARRPIGELYLLPRRHRSENQADS